MAETLQALERRIKQHVVAHTHEYLAVVQPGFETTALDELRELGITDGATIVGGITFTGRLNDCYRVNSASRTVIRVVMRLFGFKALQFDDVRKKIAAFSWELYLKEDMPLAVSITARKSRLHHTGKLAAELLGGIADRFGRPAFSDGAGEDNANAQMILLRIENDVCRLSLDASGELLHRRGYRTNAVPAPLRESTAALILRASGIGGYDVLIDPLCGSGTFSIEAAMTWSGRLPGLTRSFMFQNWPAFRPAAYQHMLTQLKAESESRSVMGTKHIICSDISPGALAAARKNIGNAGYADVVEPCRRDFLKERITVDPARKTFIVLNPPYGKRSDPGMKRAKELYRKIGRRMREWYPGCGCAVIVPGLECEKALALPHDRKIPFMNGGIPVAVLIRDAR